MGVWLVYCCIDSSLTPGYKLNVFNVFHALFTAFVQKHQYYYFRFSSGPKIWIPHAEKHTYAGN